MMGTVCNRDCFNCVFDDCILEEGPSAEEYRDLARIEKELFATPEKKKVAAQQKAYREANRESYNAYMREYLRNARRKKAQKAGA